MKIKKWIPKQMKKGALSKQLGIPEKEVIPMTLLKKIVKAKPGEAVLNPTKTGKKRIKVTRLLEKRSQLAINLKRIARKRSK